MLVVGPDGQCNPPQRHRRRRIKLGGALKRSLGFFMIEAVDQGQPLIEIVLRFFAFCNDRMVLGAQLR